MEFAVIKCYSNDVEANIVKGMLEANDIFCWLRDETLGTLRLHSSGGIKLMVREDQAQQALDLIGQTKSQRLTDNSDL